MKTLQLNEVDAGLTGGGSVIVDFQNDKLWYGLNPEQLYRVQMIGGYVEDTTQAGVNMLRLQLNIGNGMNLRHNSNTPNTTVGIFDSYADSYWAPSFHTPFLDVRGADIINKPLCFEIVTDAGAAFSLESGDVFHIVVGITRVI
jgi:hypothetical protein